MKCVSKLLILMLIFVILIPSAQSSNIFQDIKNMSKGIIEVNNRLETIKTSLDNLENTINESNAIMEDVQESVASIKDTNKEIEEMNSKLDDISNKADEALDIADKVDSYIGSLMIILGVGIGLIAIALLFLIGTVIVILKKRK